MNEEELFNLVFDIGETMLRNGGEVDRTEETIERISQAFHLEDIDSFVLVNGIFMTANSKERKVHSKVRDIPILPMSLKRIDAINTLSRDIVSGNCDPAQARVRLNEIKEMKTVSNGIKIMAYGFGSASFCFLFGGTIMDSLSAFGAGVLLSVFLLFLVPKTNLSKLFIHVFGSSLVTLYTSLSAHIWPDLQLNLVIIGGIVSLLPGVPLVSAVRYLFNDDYDSGMVRLTDALFTSLCIAVGVGVVLKVLAIL